MLKISKIKNVVLTTSFQAVTVVSTELFDGYIASTKDGTDFEIKILETDTDTFVCSQSLNTSPLNISVDRRYDTQSTAIFYVKGTADSVLQVLFIKE